MKKPIASAIAVLLAFNSHAQTSTTFGTFEKPFTADSPWNIRPVDPVLVPAELPAACGPKIEPTSELGPPVFLSKPGDPEVIVYPPIGNTNPQANQLQDLDGPIPFTSVKVKHFPADVQPAYGGDGHADIVDHETGVIHSFYGLKKTDGVWRAIAYAWTTINGRGWGDPSHIYQGARAVGVPPMAGIIRKHEIDDGEEIYQHALALSLDMKGLSPDPAYVYPATHADKDSNVKHTGKVPEGALLMLPSDYEIQVVNPKLKKVVETLKTFGARVVDENGCVPYWIYVETGAAFSLYTGADAAEVSRISAELDRIRQNLKMVKSSSGYIDGNGQPTSGELGDKVNLLSMRGVWTATQGGPAAPYNGQTGRIEFPAIPSSVEQANGSGQMVSGGPVGNNRPGLTWARPEVGATYRFTVQATGDSTMHFAMMDGPTGKPVQMTKSLKNGESATLLWRAGTYLAAWAFNPANKAGSVRATMIKE